MCCSVGCVMYSETMKKKTETLSIRIEPKLKKRIQRAALKAHMSMADYVAWCATKEMNG